MDNPNRKLQYYERNTILEKMGFKTYHDYLKSDLWKSIRERVFSECGSDCFVCANRAFQAHHEYYTEANLRGRTLTHIRPICRECHDIIEFDCGIKLMDSERIAKIAAARKAEKMRHSGIHGPALPIPPPGPNTWEYKQQKALRKHQEHSRKLNELKELAKVTPKKDRPKPEKKPSWWKPNQPKKKRWTIIEKTGPFPHHQKRK